MRGWRQIEKNVGLQKWKGEWDCRVVGGGRGVVGEGGGGCGWVVGLVGISSLSECCILIF